MQIPIKCPICNGVLLNEDRNIGYDISFIMKSCDKTLYHKIYIESLSANHDKVYAIRLHISKNLIVNWFPEINSLRVYSYDANNTRNSYKIPYFEPNFSNYKKLINKIKTYILFS